MKNRLSGLRASGMMRCEARQINARRVRRRAAPKLQSGSGIPAEPPTTTRAVGAARTASHSHRRPVRGRAGLMACSRMKNVISTGTIVMARRAEAAMANVLVYANGLKRRPDCSCRLNTGRNDTVMISRL